MKINSVMKVEINSVMKMKNKLPERKRLRLKDFDYSTSGAYFITVCTHGRKKTLSSIVGGDVLDAPKNVELLPYGEIAKKYINQLNDFYDDIKVDRYVVMPNHIHMILFVFENGRRGRRPLQQNNTRLYLDLYLRSSDFATKNMEKTFGNEVFMTTL